MKAIAEQEQVFFPKVTLTLTLESQAEVDAIHNLFNSPQVLNALAVVTGSDPYYDFTGAKVRSAISTALSERVFKERGYAKFYEALRRQFIPDGKMLVDDHPTFIPASTGGVSSGYNPDPFRGRPY